MPSPKTRSRKPAAQTNGNGRLLGDGGRVALGYQSIIHLESLIDQLDADVRRNRRSPTDLVPRVDGQGNPHPNVEGDPTYGDERERLVDQLAGEREHYRHLMPLIERYAELQRLREWKTDQQLIEQLRAEKDAEEAEAAKRENADPLL